MDHAAGKGRFTVGAKGTRVKRGPGNEFPELNAPTGVVDLWLAQNPGSKEEAAAGALGVSKTAAMVGPGGLMVGFEKEAEEIRKGIEKYGSLEEYEKHQFEDVDFFADAPEVSFKDQFTEQFRDPTPVGNCFESHAGSAGIRKTAINVRKKPEFEATDENLEKMADRHDRIGAGGVARGPKKSDPSAHIDVPKPPSRIIAASAAKKEKPAKPSKRVRLSEDFDF